MALTQDPAQNPSILFSQKTTDAQTGEAQGWERPVALLNPPRKAAGGTHRWLTARELEASHRQGPKWAEEAH